MRMVYDGNIIFTFVTKNDLRKGLRHATFFWNSVAYMRPSKWTLNLETAVTSHLAVKESDKIIAKFPLSGTMAWCERVE